ncbi:hypothetical protein [Streptomyces sp. NPDC006668]|uniref:hypothetical protein n=1 Tax=Streptomyces sp. NPDC006668 TaxID=3156903 RepID=UPI0033DC1915
MPCRPERYALAPGSTTAKSRAVARSIIDHVLKLDPGFRGIMAFPLDEALWLHGLGAKGVLVDYHSTNTELLATLAERTAEDPHGAPVVMIDSPDHVELIEHALPATTSRSRPAWTSTPPSGWPAAGSGSARSAHRSAHPSRRPRRPGASNAAPPHAWWG